MGHNRTRGGGGAALGANCDVEGDPWLAAELNAAWLRLGGRLQPTAVGLSARNNYTFVYILLVGCTPGTHLWHLLAQSHEHAISHPTCVPGSRCAVCSKLYVWSWKEHTLRQTIELGADGAIPLETRFAHEPSATWGYVVRMDCALLCFD